MDIWKSLAGMVEVEAVSADLAGLLSLLPYSGIEVEEAVYHDPLTATFRIRRRDYRKLRRLCEKRGEGLRLLGKNGLYWVLKSLLVRPVLIMGFLFLTGLHLFLPTKVLFVQGEGNRAVPDLLILERATGCGIYFGASRSAVRSEKVKNALLEALPEAAANEIAAHANTQLRNDVQDWEEFVDRGITEDNAHEMSLADEDVAKLLVSWHYQQIVLPSITEPEVDFDPMDESQVDLSGLPNIPDPFYGEA
jgi:hypothetical protein